MDDAELTNAQLTEVVSHRAVVGEISAIGQYQVVAVDVFGPWAAVFRFSVFPSGDVDSDTDIAGLRSDGSWEFYTGGGMCSAGWEVPWLRPRDGWAHGHLVTFGLCGMDIEVDDEDIEIIAVSGFVSGSADSVRVTTAGADRVVAPSRTGAFVAVGLGRGFDFMMVTAVKEGEPLSPAQSFPSPP